MQESFSFGGIVRTKRIDEFQTNPQQDVLKACLLFIVRFLNSSSSVWRTEPEIVTLQVTLSAVTNIISTNE